MADTIRTGMFASLIDFAQVEMVRFDSITYKMDDNELMVRFILKLDRIPEAMPVVKESYTMVYTSDLIGSKGLLQLEKMEKFFK